MTLRQPLRVLSFGAGAIGSYVGGSLAAAGHDVLFLEQPEVAAQLQAKGLHLTLAGQQVALEPRLVVGLEAALAQGPFDVALCALKSFSTPAFADDLRPLAAQLPPVLCLQNGVENEAVLADAIGPEKVIAASVTSALSRSESGAVVLERLRGLGVADGHPLSVRLAAALDGAGLQARLYSSPGAMKWSKMLTNLLANASSAILDETPAQIFAQPALYRLEVEQLREALRVMRALNLPVTDLPGTPVRLLALAVQRLPLGLSRPFLQRAVGAGRGAKMPSFWIDLKAGRSQSEVEYLNGAVVRFGEKLGIPTPVNRGLTRLLVRLAAGEVEWNTTRRNPAALLEAVSLSKA